MSKELSELQLVSSIHTQRAKQRARLNVACRLSMVWMIGKSSVTLLKQLCLWLVIKDKPGVYLQENV